MAKIFFVEVDMENGEIRRYINTRVYRLSCDYQRGHKRLCVYSLSCDYQSETGLLMINFFIIFMLSTLFFNYFLFQEVFFCFTPFDSMTINFITLRFNIVQFFSILRLQHLLLSLHRFNIFKQNPEFTHLCVY